MDELQDILRDHKKLKQFVGQLIPWKRFIPDYDPFMYRNVLCPFHKDSQPSAKIFKDEDGVQRLWCFAESKSYTPADYIEKILRQNLISYVLGNFDEKLIHLKSKQFEFREFERPVPIDLGEAIKLLPDVPSFLDAIFFGIPKATFQ